jgi:hypothetical protein
MEERRTGAGGRIRKWLADWQLASTRGGSSDFGRRNGMEVGNRSRTAILTAIHRAAHFLIDDPPKILGDSVAGAGNGLSAKLEELGGIDLIVVYNSGKFRMDGLPSICGLMPTETPMRLCWTSARITCFRPSSGRQFWPAYAAPIRR